MLNYTNRYIYTSYYMTCSGFCVYLVHFYENIPLKSVYSNLPVISVCLQSPPQCALQMCFVSKDFISWIKSFRSFIDLTLCFSNCWNLILNVEKNLQKERNDQ